jgi:hypothetical protein
MKPFIVVISLTLGTLLTSCQSNLISATATEDSEITSQDELINPTLVKPRPVGEGVDPHALRFGYLNDNGNHFVNGSSLLNILVPLEVPLPFQPAWLVGVETIDGTGWLSVADSGEFHAFEVVAGEVRSVALEFDSLPPGTQPSIYYDGTGIRLITTGDPNASAPSPPVYLPLSQRVAYLNELGDLIVTDLEAKEVLFIQALPDARLLVDEEDRLLVLGRRTTRYEHGVLGDAVEAGSILLIQTYPSTALVSEIQLPEHEVFEGVGPIWADLNGDGVREILATVSDREQGAYLAIYSEKGQMLARSSAIGRAFRWRHQITVADFLGENEIEIAVVLTPHIGGVLQYFTWEGGQLDLQSEAPGVSSHQIGSRNLDMALTGDFNGDQRLEILMPNADYDVLGAFQREGDEALLEWEIPLGSRLSTNIAGIAFEDGGVGFGLGLANGVVRLWLPD